MFRNCGTLRKITAPSLILHLTTLKQYNIGMTIINMWDYNKYMYISILHIYVYIIFWFIFALIITFLTSCFSINNAFNFVFQNDRGFASGSSNIFRTFVKARMICTVSNTTNDPFMSLHYNEIQDSFYNNMENILYALFTGPR